MTFEERYIEHRLSNFTFPVQKLPNGNYIITPKNFPGLYIEEKTESEARSKLKGIIIDQSNNSIPRFEHLINLLHN
jgi:hypothetical protein